MAEEEKKLAQLVKLLDEIDLGRLTLEDVKAVKNPVLAQTLRDFLSSKLAETHHSSHFVHISHYSSLVKEAESTPQR